LRQGTDGQSGTPRKTHAHCTYATGTATEAHRPADDKSRVQSTRITVLPCVGGLGLPESALRQVEPGGTPKPRAGIH